MEWKQKTLASFYLIRSFAGKDISGGAYFLEVLRRRGGFFLLLFLRRIYNIRSAFDGRIYAVFGMETGMILAFIGSGIGIYGGVAGAGLLMPPVSGLYSGVFFILQVSYTDNRMDLEKIMDLCRRKQGLIVGRDHSFSAVYRRNPRRKFSESLDRRKRL